MIFPRDITPKIQKRLSDDDVILLIGARQAGKTTILHQIEDIIREKEKHPCHFLNLEDPDYLSLLNQSPKNLFKIFPLELNSREFLLIDELQYLDNPSNFLKYFYDEYKGRLKIIASGSSAFYLDKKFKDSLAGRKRIFYVFTLSFREFLRFKGKNVLGRKDFKKLTLSEREIVNRYYHQYLIYGGYPRVALAPPTEKEEVLRDIAYSYIKKDIMEANIRQDEIFYKLFKILASQTGNLVNSSELSSTLGVSRTAVDNYLYVMQKSFHLRLIRPFSASVRKELTKMPKVFFLDLGLRNFFLKDFRPYEVRADKGALLENATFRQLLENYDFEEIKFWRTTSGREVDFVVGDEKVFEVKVQVGKFARKKYQSFLKCYPRKELGVVSLNPKKKSASGCRVFEVWEL